VSQTKVNQLEPARLSIVEEVAGFDISVNDVVRVNVAEGREQPPHVALDLGRCHQVQEIGELGVGEVGHDEDDVVSVSQARQQWNHIVPPSHGLETP
jgi:hypothetical protein